MPQLLVSGITLTVEAAFSTATAKNYAIWGSAIWDSATWGPDQTWVDITAYVRKVDTKRTFGRNINNWESGTASIELLNTDGRFSPSKTTSPYSVGGVTGIRPWIPVRIRATWAGVIYDVYRGYALSWQETYAEAYPGGGGAYVTVACTDEIGSLARFDGLAGVSVGAGESTGARVHRILDAANYRGARNVHPGNVTVQATDMSANAVSALKLVVDSEGGALYVAKDGAVVFEHNYALIENPRSNTVQGAFGDGSGDLPASDITLSYNGDLVVNIAAFQRVGGTVQVATNEPSRALYKDKRFSRSDLISETDAQVLALAQFWVSKYGEPEQLITSLQVNPLVNPNLLWPQALGREVRDLIQAHRTPPGGYDITQLCFIAGISHAITKDTWLTTFDLWSASGYQNVARWDLAVWDLSKWAF